ncbi:hypothetical protein WMY93_031803 [Mugilogobius chulae]|uniref:Uncharacterized protein n=1 Tax=Mugilogobius chulae TaxID=88201 RepID=A0AAW0MCZ9_9GOBI
METWVGPDHAHQEDVHHERHDQQQKSQEEEERRERAGCHAVQEQEGEGGLVQHQNQKNVELDIRGTRIKTIRIRGASEEPGTRRANRSIRGTREEPEQEGEGGLVRHQRNQELDQRSVRGTRDEKKRGEREPASTLSRSRKEKEEKLDIRGTRNVRGT